MKKIIFGLLIVLTLNGCAIVDNDNYNDDIRNSLGNCDVFECIELIDSSNTVEEINEIIGIKGELIDEKYNIYYWELSKNTGIEVAYYSSDNGTISCDYEYEMLKNEDVTFTAFEELQEKVRDGIYYDDFIKYIGNVEGTITEKNSYSTKYTWVSKDGKYLTGTFNSSGKCTFIIGRV